ncbi:hypothetical protein, partial [Nostoc sp. LEGE 06077]|uniref:hypothetical protein n=1 Tax=Nostoc sp. LEGE 06077 TaxID=915325 RepID=UPI001D15576C
KKLPLPNPPQPSPWQGEGARQRGWGVFHLPKNCYSNHPTFIKDVIPLFCHPSINNAYKK